MCNFQKWNIVIFLTLWRAQLWKHKMLCRHHDTFISMGADVLGDKCHLLVFSRIVGLLHNTMFTQIKYGIKQTKHVGMTFCRMNAPLSSRWGQKSRGRRLSDFCPHKGQWLGALMFSLICAWLNGWVTNREANDLGRHCAYYDVTVMCVPRLRQPRKIMLVINVLLFILNVVGNFIYACFV